MDDYFSWIYLLVIVYDSIVGYSSFLVETIRFFTFIPFTLHRTRHTIFVTCNYDLRSRETLTFRFLSLTLVIFTARYPRFSVDRNSVPPLSSGISVERKERAVN